VLMRKWPLSDALKDVFVRSTCTAACRMTPWMTPARNLREIDSVACEQRASGRTCQNIQFVKRNATDLTDLLKLSGFKVFCIRNNQTYRTFAELTQLSVVTAVCRNSMRPKTEKK